MFFRFTINRTPESLNEPCQVAVEVSGTANYASLNGDCTIQLLEVPYSFLDNIYLMTIPSGVSTAYIDVLPNVTNPPIVDKTIIFTIKPNIGIYEIGANPSATAIIPAVIVNVPN